VSGVDVCFVLMKQLLLREVQDMSVFNLWAALQ